MKKMIPILLCSILAATLLAACAGAPNYNSTVWAETDSYNYAAAPAAPQAAPMPEDAVMYDAENTGGMAGTGSFRTTGGGITPISAPATEGLAEKIIYSVYADIETLRFDETIERVYALLENYSAFVESSSISGVNYASRFHGWSEYRNAFFTLRVPQEHLNAMTISLDSLGNVVNINSSADNITAQFFDTQSRLHSLEIQEERLLSMLSQSEDITDLIALEGRLGEIRYQIESLTSTLSNWQRQVDYSTVTLRISEVEQFTEQVQIHQTYWEQMGDGFMSTIRGVGTFFMNLFLWLIVSAPVLIILAVITVVIIIIVKRKMRSTKNKRNAQGHSSAPEYTTQPGQAPLKNDTSQESNVDTE